MSVAVSAQFREWRAMGSEDDVAVVGLAVGPDVDPPQGMDAEESE
jgi:hypothetical protein